MAGIPINDFVSFPHPSTRRPVLTFSIIINADRRKLSRILNLCIHRIRSRLDSPPLAFPSLELRHLPLYDMDCRWVLEPVHQLNRLAQQRH